MDGGNTTEKADHDENIKNQQRTDSEEYGSEGEDVVDMGSINIKEKK